MQQTRVIVPQRPAISAEALCRLDAIIMRAWFDVASAHLPLPARVVQGHMPMHEGLPAMHAVSNHR